MTWVASGKLLHSHPANSWVVARSRDAERGKRGRPERADGTPGPSGPVPWYMNVYVIVTGPKPGWGLGCQRGR